MSFLKRSAIPLALLLTFFLTTAFGHPKPNMALALPEGPVLSLVEGRTYDQAHNTGYIDWSGPVGYVNLTHRDGSYLPPKEGGASCGSGCTEQVTRISSGGTVNGSFAGTVSNFEVMISFTHDSSAGTATLRACSATQVDYTYTGPGGGQALKPGYAPETVNTDGLNATQRAWLNLFPMIIIIECFLHAFIKIRERAKHLKETFRQLSQQVWNVYHAADAPAFRLQAEALRVWAEQHTTGYVLEAVHKLYAKTERFVLAYQHPLTHRTSNMLDRHLNAMARWLDSTRFFHGHWVSAERSIRAWALLHDFGPYCPRAKISQTYSSPAHKLNGFVYHQNWLHNLLISTSMSGCRC